MLLGNVKIAVIFRFRNEFLIGSLVNMFFSV